MKKSETNTLRIEPRKVHAAAVGMAMVLIYFDYHYFVETFYWVFQPPFRIAIDTVTIVAIGLRYLLPAEHILYLPKELRSFFWVSSAVYIHGSGSRVLTCTLWT